MPINDSGGREREPNGPRAWTVMVYMAAENTSELDATAVADLREMERGVTADANLVVQINRAWPTLPQRYEITRDNSRFVGPADHKNMGSAETLAGFLKWTLDHYEARNYCLVLWGHAFGLGFGRDHNDPLRLRELRAALEEFRTARGGGKLEVLGTNACAMSYAEAAYELRDCASYMVASQIAVPFAGWPYKTILSRISGSTSPLELGRLVVDAYVTHYSAAADGERVQMSLLNLEDARILPSFLKTLAAAVRGEVTPQNVFSSDRLDYVRDVFMAAAAGDVRPLIDLRDLCGGFSAAKTGALETLSHTGSTDMLKSLVVYDRAHPDLEDLRGLGIFVPFVTDEYDLKRLGLQDASVEEDDDAQPPVAGQKKEKTGREEYEDLSIFKASDSAWPRLVYDELRREIPFELMTGLTAIGATSRADRRDIAQIVLSIDASFNKLDGVLADARECVKEKLDAASRGDDKADRRDPAKQGPPRTFGPPWLRLIRPPDLAARVARLRLLEELRALEQRAGVGVSAHTGPPPSGTYPPGSREAEGPANAVVDSVVGFFQKVETAVGEVERAVRKGLTNAKFGLGPTAPNQFSVGQAIRLGDTGEEPKSTHMGDTGEEPKSTHMGDTGEEPKSTHMGSAALRKSGMALRGDLRVDLAFARVAELFGHVGAELKALEEATLEVETVARRTLANAQVQQLTPQQLLAAARTEIDRSFRILQDASVNARRTVRRVLAHPVYGVGPTSGSVSLDDRQGLAAAGGLDRRNLRLL